MLAVSLRQVPEDKVERLRSSMDDAMRRRDEIVETFKVEGVRHEVAYLFRTPEGPALLHVMEAEDPVHAWEAFQASEAPIDQEWKDMMDEALGEPIESELLFDVRLSGTCPPPGRRFGNVTRRPAAARSIGLLGLHRE